MPTQFADVFTALMAPFDSHEVKTRAGGGGRSLSYIDARTAANRLDDVLGPEAWDFEVQPWGPDQLIGTLIVRLPDGTTVRRSDVGGKADMQSGDDSTKSAASDCLKRCAALLGIGRYLYQSGVPDFARAAHANGQAQPARRVESFQQPSRPPGPPPSNGHHGNGNGHPAPQPQGGGDFGNAPRSGKGLFAWTKDMEQRYEVGLLKYLNSWSKLQGLPDRMVDFDDEQVRLAHAEAVRKLRSIGGNPEEETRQGDAYEAPAGPPRPPSSTPNTQAAAQFALQAQRNKLPEMAWRLAQSRAKADGREAGDKDYWDVLDGVEKCLAPDLYIKDFDNETDTEKFRAYLDILGEQAVLAGVN